MTLEIHPLANAQLDDLLLLWRQYQEFYRVSDIDDSRNRVHVAGLLEHPQWGHIHLAYVDGELSGFSTLYYTFASTRSCRVAILNDLFVVPTRRGRGCGGRLLDHAIEFVRNQGIGFIRWSTEADNEKAQTLYGRFGKPSEWKVYSVDVLQK